MRARAWTLGWIVAAAISGCGSPTNVPPDAGSAAPDSAIAPAGADASPSTGLDAGVVAADAAAIAPDAAGDAIDAAVSEPRDGGGIEDAAAAAGPDAAEPGPDAAAPGPDAAAPGPDAGPTCVPACAAGQACLETTCVDVAWSAACSLGAAAVLTDGQAIDDGAGSAVGASLQAGCGTGFDLTTASLSDPTVFDSAAGRLLTARGGLAITSGGFYFNALVRSLESSRTSPLYFTSGTSVIGWASSATGAPVHLFAETDVTDAHDFFVVELFPDGDGRLVLAGYGIGAAGTQAAGRQAQAMLAAPQGFPARWYVFEWTLDADAGAETINLIASGD